MNVLDFLLLLGAAVCFFVAALIRPRAGWPAVPDLIALGLLLWVLVPFIHAAQGIH